MEYCSQSTNSENLIMVGFKYCYLVLIPVCYIQLSSICYLISDVNTFFLLGIQAHLTFAATSLFLLLTLSQLDISNINLRKYLASQTSTQRVGKLPT